MHKLICGSRGTAPLGYTECAWSGRSIEFSILDYGARLTKMQRSKMTSMSPGTSWPSPNRLWLEDMNKRETPIMKLLNCSNE